MSQVHSQHAAAVCLSRCPVAVSRKYWHVQRTTRPACPPFANCVSGAIFGEGSRGGRTRWQLSTSKEFHVMGGNDMTRRFGRVGRPQVSRSKVRPSAVRNEIAMDMGAAQPLDGDSAGVAKAPLEFSMSWPAIRAIADAFYRFTRPHTMMGTAISIASVSFLALPVATTITPRFWFGMMQALLPALCMNIAIVGMNQVYDIAIDAVNKPYLPLASGEFSKETGVAISLGFAALGTILGILSGSQGLLATLLISLLLGFIYSVDLPFLRWKQYPMLAASCILSVRAVLVQLGFYHHMKVAVLGGTMDMTLPLVFGTAFMCFFSIVIALFKDMPDVEGDRLHRIFSMSVRLGVNKVFWICVSMLLSAYAGAIVVGATATTYVWSKAIVIVGHIILASLLISRAREVDLSRKEEITSYYMFIWKLFYAEYLLLPFVR